MLALQIQARVPKLRDWEEVVEAYITKAAMAHAPSKLLAMHNAVPNASSRMVFQSRQTSIQPGMDLDLAKAEDSSCDSSHGSASLSAQPHQLLPDNTQQLLNQAAAVLQHVLESASSATALCEAVSNQPSMECPPQQSEQQLNTKSTNRTCVPDPQTGSAIQSQDRQGIRRLAPLLPLPPLSLQKQQSASTSLSDGMPHTLPVAHTHTVDAAGADESGRQQHQQQPPVQGVSASQLAASAAHQARLASLHAAAHPGQTHGFGRGTGHAELPPVLAQAAQRPRLDKPQDRVVQHSAVRPARPPASLQLAPVLRTHGSAADPRPPAHMQPHAQSNSSDDLPAGW